MTGKVIRGIEEKKKKNLMASFYKGSPLFFDGITSGTESVMKSKELYKKSKTIMAEGGFKEMDSKQSRITTVL